MSGIGISGMASKAAEVRFDRRSPPLFPECPLPKMLTSKLCGALGSHRHASSIPPHRYLGFHSVPPSVIGDTMKNAPTNGRGVVCLTSLCLCILELTPGLYHSVSAILLLMHP